MKRLQKRSPILLRREQVPLAEDGTLIAHPPTSGSFIRLGPTRPEAMRLIVEQFFEHRTLLRNGQWRRVVVELTAATTTGDGPLGRATDGQSPPAFARGPKRQFVDTSPDSIT